MANLFGWDKRLGLNYYALPQLTACSSSELRKSYKPFSTRNRIKSFTRFE